MESIENEKTRQFEEIIRKERLELEKQEYERELDLKETEMELAYREKLEMERLQVEKLRLQNENELKCTETGINAKECDQQNSGQRATHKATVKLPKLELMKFDGNLLIWQEFLDSFDATVNRNPSLEDTDKLDAHYSKLRDIPIVSTYYEKLRSTYDHIERHIRSLETLGQNVENEFMVSLIRSKLP